MRQDDQLGFCLEKSQKQLGVTFPMGPLPGLDSGLDRVLECDVARIHSADSNGLPGPIATVPEKCPDWH